MAKLLIAWSVTVFSLALGSPGLPAAPAPAPLQQVGTLALPNVQGRIDHLNVDLPGRRLLIAALGNHSVEVVDLKAGKRVTSLPDVTDHAGPLRTDRQRADAGWCANRLLEPLARSALRRRAGRREPAAEILGFEAQDY